MTAITISDLYPNAQIKINVETQSQTHQELVFELEKEISILEGGKHALAHKTFRSARFTLIKNLVSIKQGNILSFQSKEEWEEDEILYKRIGTNIIHAEDYSLDEWEILLEQKNISIIYISTLQQKTLAINDFGYIIYTAHKENITVIFDNTYGGLGHIYAPLIDGADFVLTDVSSVSSVFKNLPIRAFIVEGIRAVTSLPDTHAFEYTFLEKIKLKRKLSVQNSLIIPESENYIGKLLKKEARKKGDFSRTANYVARWLNNQSEIMEVNYPGLKASESHIHAELYFKGGYGNLFRFSLWDVEYGYSLLKGFIRSGKIHGVNITIDNNKKEFIVEINTENYTHVLQYFQKIFTNLKQNIDFKEQITKENHLRKVFDNELKQLLLRPIKNKK